MIPSNIKKEHVMRAIREIDSKGMPSGRKSRSFCLRFEGKLYPLKYVVSLANKFANGEELDSSKFSGGHETNNFLKRLGFDILGTSSANPEDPKDITKFREQNEDKRKKLSGWVATVILQSNGSYSNHDRLSVLAQIVDSVTTVTEGEGVILFPGGWFTAGEQEAREVCKWAEQHVRDILAEKDRDIIISLGIDGRVTQYARDQIGIAINHTGIIAMGRKFHPAPIEKGYVELASDHLSNEENKSRVFSLSGRNYYLCVCYDSFGIRQRAISNFGIDVILDLVHGFYPKGEGGSGDVYFAKHGFAGASKQWSCLVFGAAVFFRRKIPEHWPSGVYWTQGAKSTQEWRYEDNPIKPKVISKLSVKEGIALIKIYTLPVL